MVGVACAESKLKDGSGERLMEEEDEVNVFKPFVRGLVVVVVVVVVGDVSEEFIIIIFGGVESRLFKPSKRIIVDIESERIGEAEENKEPC